MNLFSFTKLFFWSGYAICQLIEYTLRLFNRTICKQYVVDAYTIQVLRPENQKPKITVHLREQYYNPTTGYIVEDKTAGYQIVKGQVRSYHDGSLMEKQDSLGNTIYEEDGITPQLGRDNSYERVIWLLENGFFTKEVALAGIKEYYKIP